jgi:thioesterase domain-containing protein
MLSELGEIARRRGLSLVNARFVATQKNQPARQFLESVAAGFLQQADGGWCFGIPVDVARGVAYSPTAVEPELPAAGIPPRSAPDGASGRSTSRRERYERIAAALSSPEKVLGMLESPVRRRATRSAPEHDFVAPKTETETALAHLWAQLLRLEPIGVRDSFFDLGGTSLLAVDLFARIERQIGKRLPLAALIEAPTVEKLALLVAGTGMRDSLVLIRPGGDQPPLFLVHDGDGETMLYRNLALLLEPKHAVYGLQPASRENVPILHTRVSEMAAYHIEKIRSVQPRGPYCLGGMCAGGVIAVEIARQLQRQGDTVAMVGLLDAADSAARPKAIVFTGERMRSFSTVFSHDRSVRFDQMVRATLSRSLRKVKNLTTYVVGRHVKELTDAIRVRLFRFHRDRGLRLPRSLERIPVRTVYLVAEREFRPDGPFEGELILFRATAGTGADLPFTARYADPVLGWGRRATKGVRVHDVPGGHSSMLQEPHVRALARQIQSRIDLALAELESPASSPPNDAGLVS